jgi:hypothetical protein
VQPHGGVDVLVTLEPDGTVTENPTGDPTAWLPDGSGFRVVMRFIQAIEGVPTYTGLRTTYARYTDVLNAYPTYNAMQTDPALAINYDVDIACMLTGCTVRNGKSGVFTEIQAATADLSIYDPNGLFDPRSTNTVLGPGRRVRAGTWVQVIVRPVLTSSWVPMFTGLVDTWSRNIVPEGASDVRVECSDFFTALGSAGYSGAVAQELTDARANRLITPAWQSSWGTVSLATGTVTLDARTFDNEQTIDQLKASAAVEDGRVFVAPNGTFTFQTATWRQGRNAEVTFLGLGASEFLPSMLACTYNRVATFIPNYGVVLHDFLTYNDLLTCNAAMITTRVPTVCASKMSAEDSADDVVNDVSLEYSAPQTPIGYTAKTNVAVNPNAPIVYRAQDTASQMRYGIRSIRRGDLTPLAHATVLPPLAQRWVTRWKDGDATITAVEVDIAAEGGNTARVLTSVFAGDLVNVVDLVPGPNATDAWAVSSAEIAGASWNINPERFTVAFTLDELRAIAT